MTEPAIPNDNLYSGRNRRGRAQFQSKREQEPSFSALPVPEDFQSFCSSLLATVGDEGRERTQSRSGQ